MTAATAPVRVSGRSTKGVKRDRAGTLSQPPPEAKKAAVKKQRPLKSSKRPKRLGDTEDSPLFVGDTPTSEAHDEDAPRDLGAELDDVKEDEVTGSKDEDVATDLETPIITE